MSSADHKLFQPLRVGAWDLSHRVVMPGLTRRRADPDTLAPVEMMADYYGARATKGGLIISEATVVSEQGRGYTGTPGIWNDVQVEGWKRVTDAVHNKGGVMLIQLWHVGRHSELAAQPVAPSAIPAGIPIANQTPDGPKTLAMPRALETSEIPGIVNQYAEAVQRAKRAGFDGVEINAGNGYLLDQFQKTGTNKRTDQYGGSVENRARLTLDVAEAASDIWDESRVGVRFSPVAKIHDMTDANPQETFGYLARKLGELKIAYVHMIEGETVGGNDRTGFDYAAVRQLFPGTYIANNGYTRQLALERTDAGDADLISFGRPFIANPKLPLLLYMNKRLNDPDSKTFYFGGREGYVEGYPESTGDPRARLFDITRRPGFRHVPDNSGLRVTTPILERP